MKPRETFITGVLIIGALLLAVGVSALLNAPAFTDEELQFMQWEQTQSLPQNRRAP